MSSPRARSRSGCSATTACRAATASAAHPVAIRSSACRSRAATRSSSSLRASGCANSRPANSPRAGPRAQAEGPIENPEGRPAGAARAASARASSNTCRIELGALDVEPVPALDGDGAGGGLVAHPISRARDAFAFYRDLTQSAPDELTVYFNLFADPAAPEEKLAAMIACHCGDPAAAEADLKPLRTFGTPAPT